MRKNAAKPVTIRNGLVGRFYSYRLRIDRKRASSSASPAIPRTPLFPTMSRISPLSTLPGSRRTSSSISPTSKRGEVLRRIHGLLLNEIAVDNVVYSLFLSMNSYGVKIGMNLSDDIFELPMRNPVSLGCMDTFVTASQKGLRLRRRGREARKCPQR